MEHQQIQEIRNFPQQLCHLNSYEIQSKTHQYLPLKYAVLENYLKNCGLAYKEKICMYFMKKLNLKKIKEKNKPWANYLISPNLT